MSIRNRNTIVPNARFPQAHAHTSTSMPVPDQTEDDMDIRFPETGKDSGVATIKYAGRTIRAGGKITRTTVATKNITENVKNTSFTAYESITERRDGPIIGVTHTQVTTTTTCGNISSQTKATKDAEITMTDKKTTAGGDILIKYQAKNSIRLNETNVTNQPGPGKKLEMPTPVAKRVHHMVDGRQRK